MLSMSDVPLLLHRVVHRMDRAADRVLRRELGISNRNVIALVVLETDGPMSQRALALSLGHTEPAVTALVRELVKTNAVEVTPINGRECSLSVTDEGARLVEAAHALIDPMFDELVTAAGADAHALEEQLRLLDRRLEGQR